MGLGISRTNADSQWNPVYKAFLRICCCGDETIRRFKTKWFCTRILSGIQFTTHFIEFFLVETKQFVGGFVNVILTRQTCGQRWSTSVRSKHKVLAFCFCVRICHMFLISKCRRESNLGLCTTSVLANRMPPRIGKFQQTLRPHTFFKSKVATPQRHSLCKYRSCA